jgi:hypothetical protein
MTPQVFSRFGSEIRLNRRDVSQLMAPDRHRLRGFLPTACLLGPRSLFVESNLWLSDKTLQ